MQTRITILSTWKKLRYINILEMWHIIVYFAKKLEKEIQHKNLTTKNLIVGAFLHDLFLYDWHEKDKLHRWHGYRHPLTASKNAREMCDANEETTKNNRNTYVAINNNKSSKK